LSPTTTLRGDFRVELHTITAPLRQDLTKRRQHRHSARIVEPQQIKIARAAVRIIEPAHHQHCALPHEAVGVG
jgi:hypothetical protein